MVSNSGRSRPLEDLARRHGLALILQFGSTVDGAVHEHSDLDIAVLFDRRPPGLDERGEEEATVAYYESLTPDERREDAAMAMASSRAARHLAVDRVPAAGRRQRRKR